MLIAQIAVATLIPAGGLANDTVPPEYQRDDEIFFQFHQAIDCHPGDQHGACFQSCRKIVLRGMATRVVGRGLRGEGDVDEQNHLVDPNRYIADGVVSSHALLNFEVWNGSGYGTGWWPRAHASTVRVNGTVINDAFLVQYGQGSPDAVRVKLRVPIGLIRWASRVPFGEPIPKENIIEIETDVDDESNSFVSNECGDHDGMYFGLRKDRPGQEDWRHDEAVLSFEALAPVVMVHGIHSDKRWFSNRGFVDAFDEARVSYLRAPNRARPDGEQFETAKHKFDSLSDGPIEGPIQLRLAQELEWAAEEFGSQYVHVIAHSKGGLWSRAAIEHLSEKPETQRRVGVYSLLTLDTPHLGSVLSDFADYSANHLKYDGPKLQAVLSMLQQPYSVEQPMFWIFLASGQFNWSQSIPDLRPWEAAKFNTRNRLPEEFTVKGRSNRVRYHLIGADANLNGDREPFAPDLARISGLDETEGWGLIQWACPLLSLGLQLYGEVDWNIDTGELTEVRHLQPPYPANDFAVTIPSQFFQDPKQSAASKRFSFYRSSPAQPMKKNHTTISDQDVGAMVRGLYRWEFQK